MTDYMRKMVDGLFEQYKNSEKEKAATAEKDKEDKPFFNNDLDLLKQNTELQKKNTSLIADNTKLRNEIKDLKEQIKKLKAAPTGDTYTLTINDNTEDITKEEYKEISKKLNSLFKNPLGDFDDWLSDSFFPHS